MRARSCVFFHAHPDDEALLTAGTMARLAHEGHRVVLVFATDGDRGFVPEAVSRGRRVADVRRAEALASARALGCARVEFLGYGDSGHASGATGTPGAAPPGSFCAADPGQAADRLAALLAEERADLLTTYDPVGGYGHRDHVRVHLVGERAARLAGTPVVLEATFDRDLLARAAAIASRYYQLRRTTPPFDIGGLTRAYTSRAILTHRIDVRPFTAAKRASMAAHVSQATGGDTPRVLAVLLRLPEPVFRRVLGAEWYVQRGLPGGLGHEHPLATLRFRASG